MSLHEPSITGNEWTYVKECLDTNWVSSAGKYVEKFEMQIAEYTGAKHAIACVNGTAALQISLRLSGVHSGCEVIVPALTFIAPINAVHYNGADPIFMDADQHFNLDIQKTIQFINEETQFKNEFTYNKKTGKQIVAVVPVHVWGNAVWMDELVQLCNERNIEIIEDASESLGTWNSHGKFKGRHTGTLGQLGCLSFNGNKIITAGGGGMILTDDEKLADKARYLTTQAKKDPIRYIHEEIGYNFRLSNINAAVGVGQLEQLDDILEKKKKIYQQYVEKVGQINGLSISLVPDFADNNHWLNILRIEPEKYGKDRDALMKILADEGIQTRPVWYPNHFQKPYKDCQAYHIENAEHLVETSLCLPSSSQLVEEDIIRIIRVLNG
ncbi:MAG: LegC family aminotransferase [Proteobacteria bacterium]|nr:LegC family aminotransferase [Pseudomonadota bacterium]MBU1389482.1 LegC family aminotransferase [Pseudomonadota bacterium]MBU1541302.1 LegC family aminotransferase [Pseudomonadota bacterium]